MLKHKQRLTLTLVLILILSVPTPAFAQSSSSTNYQVDQTFFGTGGDIDSTSTNYRSRITVGELGIGETSSTNYRAFAGYNTTDEPFLEVVVTGANINLGYISPTSASTTTGSFYVRAWQASGYVVRTGSDPPTNTNGTGQTIAPLTSPTASSPGTEQFGINLVDNSSPNVGTDPQQVHSFSTGIADTGYDTANQFKYTKGDSIAKSTNSSGTTIFTISYLYNISEVTESGQYNFSHIIIATGTY